MDYPILRPTMHNTFVVVEEYKLNGVVVPVGYQTNGADVPRVLWSYVPPFKPSYLPAVLIHDYLCSQGLYLKADALFEEILLEIEDSSKTRNMIRGVQFYTKYVR